MQLLLASVALIGCLGMAHALNGTGGRGAALICLSQADLREKVWAREIVAPALAVGVARDALPFAELLRARLCLRGDELVYVIIALRRNGRFVQVTVDATSGKLRGVE